MLTDPTLAIESVMDAMLADAILARHPRQQGATVADLLDMASEADAGLDQTEPAWATWGPDVLGVLMLAHPNLRGTFVVRLVNLAMLALILAGEQVTEQGTRDLAGAAAARVAQGLPTFA